jgi:hypothetical protein
MFSMYHDLADGGYWQGDALADEGDTNVTTPQWVASTGENDPAGYVIGANPVLSFVNITRPDSFTGDAKLRITEASGLLVFSDTTIPFTSGTPTPCAAPPTTLCPASTYGYAITSSQALPSTIANLQPQLTWSLSIDGGTNFIPFAWTYHNVFVAAGPSAGFPGYTTPEDLVVTPARAHVTAARVNYVTTQLAGLSDPDAITQALQTFVTSLFTAGTSGKLADHFDNNPWEWLDNPYNGYPLDCYSLNLIGAVLLGQSGVAGYLGVAFPTTDGDATEQDHQNAGLSNQTDLVYYLANGTELDAFEAFLAPTLSADAYTFLPVSGPYYPWTSPAVTGLPSDTLGQLHFTVIFNELEGERHAAVMGSQGGQQWWINHAGNTLSSGPVTFPVTIP